MKANGFDRTLSGGTAPPQTWQQAWHLWRVWLPRRSITGRLVWGIVWRRAQGRRWIYKKFTEYR
jgi:hypothetical protein